jgi:hypothetical protein
MDGTMLKINLAFAWLWILLGFLSGLVLGLFFHREDWLGGYASFKRRLYRLAHISCFGLGMVNFLFYLTAQNFSAGDPAVVKGASWAFVAGAVTMPVCCLLTAHLPRTRMFFAIPVMSLITGGTLTIMEVIKL